MLVTFGGYMLKRFFSYHACCLVCLVGVRFFAFLLAIFALTVGSAKSAEMAPRLVPLHLVPANKEIRNIRDLGPNAGTLAAIEIPVFSVYPSNPAVGRVSSGAYIAYMVDLSSGNIVPNATMILGALQQEPLSGGHDHDSPSRPNGSMSAYAGNTGANGLGFQVVFTAPEFSGKVLSSVNCTAPGYLPCATGYFYSFFIEVPGLVELLPSSAYALTGVTPEHNSNHWASQSFLAKIHQFANAWYLRWGGMATPKIAVNDISLAKGGRFDVKGTWTGSHAEHRIGVTADIRTPPYQRHGQVELMLIAAGIVGTTKKHVPPDVPHWHIREFNTRE